MVAGQWEKVLETDLGGLSELEVDVTHDDMLVNMINPRLGAGALTPQILVHNGTSYITSYESKLGYWYGTGTSDQLWQGMPYIPLMMNRGDQPYPGYGQTLLYSIGSDGIAEKTAINETYGSKDETGDSSIHNASWMTQSLCHFGGRGEVWPKFKIQLEGTQAPFLSPTRLEIYGRNR